MDTTSVPQRRPLTRRPTSRTARGRAGRAAGLLLLVIVAVGGLSLSACQSTFEVERRETPVHTWLTIPAYAASGGQIQGDVVLGPHRIVNGAVTFPRGVPTVELPTVYVQEGAYGFRLHLQGGQVRAAQAIEVEQECWIQVVVNGSIAEIEVHEEQPDGWGRS